MFADPQKNLLNFGLAPGLIVADIGASTGEYALPAARMISAGGSNGKLYAIDLQKDLLDKLKNDAQHQGITNVEIIWGNAEKLGGTKLRTQSVDAIIISNIFFQINDADKSEFLKEQKRILKPRGRILFLEWSAAFGGVGPSKKDVVSPEKASQLFAAAGFICERDVPVGSHHYGKIFRLTTSQ